jgi:hypothetical protein
VCVCVTLVNMSYVERKTQGENNDCQHLSEKKIKRKLIAPFDFRPLDSEAEQSLPSVLH